MRQRSQCCPAAKTTLTDNLHLSHTRSHDRRRPIRDVVGMRKENEHVGIQRPKMRAVTQRFTEICRAMNN